MPGCAYLVLPFTFATADATALLTLQAGQQLRLWDLYWQIAADMTGGSSSAIGVSSNKTGYSTKGDLLGGASGDVAASLTLALSPTVGTIGAKVDGTTLAPSSSRRTPSGLTASQARSPPGQAA